MGEEKKKAFEEVFKATKRRAKYVLKNVCVYNAHMSCALSTLSYLCFIQTILSVPELTIVSPVLL